RRVGRAGSRGSHGVRGRRGGCGTRRRGSRHQRSPVGDGQGPGGGGRASVVRQARALTGPDGPGVDAAGAAGILGGVSIGERDDSASSAGSFAGSSAGAGIPQASAGLAGTRHEADESGHFGVYGGRFVPEALLAVIEEVTAEYAKARLDEDFLAELDRLQRHYTGRPSPVYDARRLSEQAGGARMLLKREDLNHTGSHKINNVL